MQDMLYAVMLERPVPGRWRCPTKVEVWTQDRDLYKALLIDPTLTADAVYLLGKDALPPYVRNIRRELPDPKPRFVQALVWHRAGSPRIAYVGLSPVSV